MSDIVEAVARAICVAEGIDPDQTSIGFGYRIPVGVEYTLWEAQRKNAEAAIAAVGVETEQLRAQNEQLRARVAVLETALRYYADDGYNGHNTNGSCARAALEVKP
jgi:hypothetical protein